MTTETLTIHGSASFAINVLTIGALEISSDLIMFLPAFSKITTGILLSPTAQRNQRKREENQT